MSPRISKELSNHRLEQSKEDLAAGKILTKQIKTRYISNKISQSKNIIKNILF